MRKFASFIISLLAVVCIHADAPDTERKKYNFNSKWQVYIGDLDQAQAPGFDDSRWKSVTTPYAWNEDDAFHLSNTNLSTGIAWYRKHFRVPPGTLGRKVFLEFEGIRHAGEFYLNGQWIGRHENGVMAFGFDITNALQLDAENVLAARIDSSWDYRELSTNTTYQWNDQDFYANYGGINRNVYLHITGTLYQTLPLYSNLNTTGVYIYATEINIPKQTAKVTAESQVRNEDDRSRTFTYNVEVMTLDRQTVKTIQGEPYTIHPNETKVVHASGQVSGLEFWSWGYGYLYDVHTSLVENDQPVDTVITRTGFRKTAFNDGMFKLNDRALHLKGYAQRSTNEWPALGCAIPAWLSDFSNKLILGSNGNLIRWMHVTPWRQDTESLDRLGILQAMPAGDKESDAAGRQWTQRVEVMRDAIIYNRNNPSIVFYEAGNYGISEGHMEEMKALRDTFDPNGGRAAGSREMLNSTVAEYGGEMLYINKGARVPLWQMEYSRDEGLRKYWDNYSPPYHADGDGPLFKGSDASAYNRNQDTHAVENVRRWFDYYEQRPGTGSRVNAGGVNIVFSDTNTHGRGAENYRRSGEVDAMRLPKDGWYAHRVMWDNWVDIEHAAGHIVGHWNYNSSTTKDIYVVSTAEQVELFLNERSLGLGDQSSRFLYTFSNVSWESGELKAIGSLDNAKEVVLDTKVTSGEPVAIRLVPHVAPAGFLANGGDVALVEVEVVDSNGRRVPTALNMIDFALEGEATWRGGLAQGPDNYIRATSLPVENGVNRVLLRSTTMAGEVVLRATSAGLESHSITLTTKHFADTDGLSTQMPGEGLSPNLSRGPTPIGDSYAPSRKAIVFQNLTAGSYEGTATAICDDDERTQWKSDTRRDSAWVNYAWDSPVNVSQVVLKLNNFVFTKYPIQISVDNEVVWKGSTPNSLGYVTLDLNATVGTNATIGLWDDGELGILEAEVYTPA
ncbi:beta-galactosidase [Aspergillus avenaceus]|uniref:Beta-galactosidase n=1 Tax=Aspergillus avenaceus TaxID=36643 RepID=A0A5N6TYY6_ASPAV|nr:beta-galactosidase [Aspergillus avenaceus]